MGFLILGNFGASFGSSAVVVVVSSSSLSESESSSTAGRFSLSLARIACCSSFHWRLDIKIHDHPVSSVPGRMHGRRLRLDLIALRSFLTSALVGCGLTMCWDGLVSKLSRISATVASMVGVLVAAGAAVTGVVAVCWLLD